MKRVLVTGAAGRLGGRVAERLARDGWTVRCLVHRRPVRGFEQAHGGLGDRDALERAAADVDAVVHLAALTHARDPRAYVRVNDEGTRNLIAAARGVERFVLVSTRAIADAGGAYSRSKAAAEHATGESGVPHVVVRLPEVYGTGGGEGVDDVIARARRGAVVPVVAGEVCPLYVDDAVDACVGALTRPGLEGRTYTLAGDCLSTRAFAERAVRLAGSSSRVVTVPFRLVQLAAAAGRFAPLPVFPDQPSRLRARKPGRTETAFAELGFRARPLEEGLRAALARDAP